MRTSFEVRDRVYDIEIARGERPEGDKFEIYRAALRDADGALVNGTLKLTETAILLAEEKAGEEGGTPEEWLARGCARSLAAEILIRKPMPDFSFVIDHRWI
jgi:hypothetical protein